MILFAYILLYSLVGYVIGRVWYKVYSRRKDDLVMFTGVVGIFWPASLILIPLLWYIVVPSLLFAAKHINRGIDAAVDRLDPQVKSEVS